SVINYKLPIQYKETSMHRRNLSPRRMFGLIGKNHKPEYQFEGESKKDFAAWKRKAFPRVMSTLGDYPERCEPNPQLLGEWVHDDVRKQRSLIDIHPLASVTFLINYPLEMEEDEKRPTL